MDIITLCLSLASIIFFGCGVIGIMLPFITGSVAKTKHDKELLREIKLYVITGNLVLTGIGFMLILIILKFLFKF